MKKLLSAFLAVVLLFGLAVTAFAATPLQFVITGTNGHPGEDVTVTISLADNPGMAAASGTLTYDNQTFTLKSASALISAGTFVWKEDGDGNITSAKFSWANGAGNYKGNAPFVSYTFTVSESAVPGDYTFGISFGKKDTVSNYNDVDLDYTVVPGKVTVEPAGCSHANKTQKLSMPASCTSAGNDAYYTCPDCGAILAADGTTELDAIPVIPALAHSFEKVNGEWKCTVCGTPFTGTWEGGNGIAGLYYFIDGERVAPYYGLVKYKGDFYYINDGGKAAASQSRYVYAEKTHGLTFDDGTPVSQGYYDFDADGKMQIFTGIRDDRYYINGVPVASYYGLVKDNGSFYYVDANSTIIKNAGKYLKTTNGLTFEDGSAIPNATFLFDEDGKMMVFTGIRDDHYYINGVAVGSYYGLVEDNGSFYYVDANSKIIKDADKYLKTTNDLTFEDETPIPHDTFHFDEEGRMVIPQVNR